MSKAHTHALAPLPSPIVEEVSQGIYAYLQPDGSWGLNNTGFIVGPNSVAVIDTCFTEARTRAFLKALRRITHLPPRTLVNTHHHGDHTNGNYLLPGATIIAHKLCREMMIETGLVTPHPLFPSVEWGGLELSPPTVTFEDRLEIQVDDLTMELIFVGPAHSTNDIVGWFPDRKVLFCGDLIFNQCTPFAAMGSITGWLRALDTLKQLEPETIVPGHGPVCGPAVIADVAAYLRFVQKVATQGFDSRLSPLESAKQVDLGYFAPWCDAERLVGNLYRAYSEIRGEPLGSKLELGPIATDMIAYNGGKPLRCLA